MVPNPMGDNMEEDFFDSNEHLARYNRSSDLTVSDAAHIQSQAGETLQERNHNAGRQQIQTGGIANAS
jgi:hypothetical protein